MSEESADILVSCGGVQGKLIMSEFVCPGIHQQCIEVNGERMTPKAFCVIGDKERLKDWKNAIRINGKSIRRRMYARDIDFYKHNEICTGRCMSRNLIPGKHDLNDASPHVGTPDADNSSRVWSTFVHAPDSQEDSPYNVLSGGCGSSRPCRGKACLNTGQVVFPEQEMIEASQQEMMNSLIKPSHIKQEVCSDDPNYEDTQLYNVPMDNSQCAEDINDTSTVEPPNSSHRRKTATPQRLPSNGASRSEQYTQKKNGAITEKETKIMQLVAEFPDTDSLFEDSVTFWQGVRDIGVLDNVVRDVKHALDNIKNDMTRIGVHETDACKLSAVVKDMGLVTKLKWRLADHKANTETEKNQLLKEIEDLKKKVAQSELKQEELKRKAKCFDVLLDLSQPHKRQRSNDHNTSTNNQAELTPDEQTNQNSNDASVHTENKTIAHHSND